MPSIERVESEIRTVEGFQVVIRHALNRRDVRGDKGNVPGYRRKHQRKARQNHTVADWIRLRLREDYPGFTVTVLRANGRPASGRVLLANLRAEYD
jgi:hypothetical protein